MLHDSGRLRVGPHQFDSTNVGEGTGRHRPLGRIPSQVVPNGPSGPVGSPSSSLIRVVPGWSVRGEERLAPPWCQRIREGSRPREAGRAGPRRAERRLRPEWIPHVASGGPRRGRHRRERLRSARPPARRARPTASPLRRAPTPSKHPDPIVGRWRPRGGGERPHWGRGRPPRRATRPAPAPSGAPARRGRVRQLRHRPWGRRHRRSNQAWPSCWAWSHPPEGHPSKFPHRREAATRELRRRGGTAPRRASADQRGTQCPTQERARPRPAKAREHEPDGCRDHGRRAAVDLGERQPEQDGHERTGER